jgi:hypothetical protein
VTIVPSMIDISWAMQTTTSAIQRARADLLCSVPVTTIILS